MRCIKQLVIPIPWLLFGTLKAQDTVNYAGNFAPPAKPLTIYATKVNGNIKVDGKLNEPDWQSAHSYSNFLQIDPNQGLVAKYQTVVKILFDGKNLYIGAHCKDSAGKKGIRIQDFRRDFDYFSNDLLGVALDPFNGRRNAICFQTNPYGALRDLQVFDDVIFDREWDALWTARSNISDSGWTCELALPWKTLRYPKGINDTLAWGFNVNRIARRENENSSLSPYPRSFDAYRMDYAALLKGLEPPPPSTNIQASPYWVNELNQSRETGKETTRSYQPKIGGEIKWSPTVHSTIDLTVNTDFAQADADRQVNNLSRFSVFFPERRQFFLENAGLFDAGDSYTFKPFFSRSIGLDSNGNTIPIDAGVRFTDKNNHYSLGGLYVHQRKTDNAQAANFGVLRFLKNYGTQNNIGLLLTNRIDEANDSVKSNTNTTATVTGFNRFNSKLSFNYTLTGSKNSGNTNDDGLATFTRLVYNSNSFALYWNTSYISKSFNPKSGFVSRNNFIKNYADIYLIRRKQKWFPRFVRSWEPGVELDIYHNPDNLKLQEAYLGPYPIFFIFNNGTKFIGRTIFNWQTLSVPFNPLGIEIAPGNYQYNQLRVEYYSDQSSKLSYSVDATKGGYYNGRITSLLASLRYAPSPHFALTVNYQANYLREVGINKEDLNTQLVTPNIRIAANPRLQMNVFYQYNTATERSRWNARFSWEYKPLSYIYIVWNENKTTGFREDQTITKISYLKQF